MSAVNVLVIDDNEIFLRFVSRFLGRFEGIRVVGTACEAEDGLAQAARLLPDVILVDLCMPPENGFQVISELRNAMPSAGILAISFYETEAYTRNALKSGADRFLAKARLGSELVPLIREVAQARTHSEGPVSLTENGRVPHGPACQHNR